MTPEQIRVLVLAHRSEQAVALATWEHRHHLADLAPQIMAFFETRRDRPEVYRWCPIWEATVAAVPVLEEIIAMPSWPSFFHDREWVETIKQLGTEQVEALNLLIGAANNGAAVEVWTRLGRIGTVVQHEIKWHRAVAEHGAESLDRERFDSLPVI